MTVRPRVGKRSAAGLVLSLTSWLLLACAGVAIHSGRGMAQEAPATDDSRRFAERLRAMEEANRRLEDANREQSEQLRRLLERIEGRDGSGNGSADSGRQTEGGSASGSNGTDSRSSSSSNGEAASAASPSTGDSSATSSDGPVPNYLDLDITSPQRFPLKATFGPGFQWQTDDSAFRLQIHYESQVEGRAWGPADETPANGGMYLPRQRIFFVGNITKPIEYEFAINRGLNNINLLNAFINFHFDDRFEVRIGRYFVPLLYEQYAVSNYWLLTPERSLFSTNLGLNRQFGAMAWGYLFDKRLDYAVGVFNGSRNSFENLDNNVDVVSYLDLRPFQHSGWTALRNFNIGSSVSFGRQDASPAPVVFRVGAGSPDTNIPGPATVPFLTLDPDVLERGNRVIGSVHAAYFLGGLSVLGEWQYGYGHYVPPAGTAPVQVPFSGFYLGAGYFLTGEQVEQRTRVKPRRPLIPLTKDEERGLGAWEVVSRVSRLQAGEEVFTAGLADPSRWSRSATTTEVGLNWYWNDYMKFYLFWLHAEFGEPIRNRSGGPQRTADMAWLRCQLYF